jgi:hypothetical protein
MTQGPETPRTCGDCEYHDKRVACVRFGIDKAPSDKACTHGKAIDTGSSSSATQGALL